MEARRTLDSNSEIQRERLEVAIVVLKEDEAVVKVGVKRRQIVEEALPSEPLRLR